MSVGSDGLSSHHQSRGVTLLVTDYFNQLEKLTSKFLTLNTVVLKLK